MTNRCQWEATASPISTNDDFERRHPYVSTYRKGA
jgi:hypothetical protein